MRLDKFLSDASAYSRKELRAMIRRGTVSVDGNTVKNPEFQVSESSAVAISGTLIRYRKFVYLMMNKPAGFISATEDGNAPVVTELLPEEYRHFAVFPAGRLDKDTEGFLILTNDGAFAHRVTAPRHLVWKRYRARLDLPAEAGDAAAFEKPMDLGDFTTAPGRLHICRDPYEVVVEISEGKFHQVKRMCEKQGKKVVYLKREAIGGVSLDPQLPSGAVRELNSGELARIESGELPLLDPDTE